MLTDLLKLNLELLPWHLKQPSLIISLNFIIFTRPVPKKNKNEDMVAIKIFYVFLIWQVFKKDENKRSLLEIILDTKIKFAYRICLNLNFKLFISEFLNQ
ncbi:hypothetical protein BpHYR1_017474 [Brachionus plicatilis]|uniref:Uncharacterized protein n=1 Tax=Brachionus plicatilis TaxID=10195 RepID=A0A3M7PKL1_BRAPC|nr:hypothetical protein BpHYR1_017474 [Brachionus plicatilis]